MHKLSTTRDDDKFVFTRIRAALDEPIRLILLFLTIAPKIASIVVGFTSGSILQISFLEIGVRMFNTLIQYGPFW